MSQRDELLSWACKAGPLVPARPLFTVTRDPERVRPMYLDDEKQPSFVSVGRDKIPFYTILKRRIPKLYSEETLEQVRRRLGVESHELVARR